jgi:hypothetical protein
MGSIAPENGRIGPEKLRQIALQDEPPHAARPLQAAGRTPVQSALIRGAREPARLGHLCKRGFRDDFRDCIRRSGSGSPVLVAAHKMLATLLPNFSCSWTAFSGAVGHFPEQWRIDKHLIKKGFRSGRLRYATRTADDPAAESGAGVHHQLLKLQRAQFGRKSGWLPDDQLQLGLEDTEAAIAKGDAEAERRDPALRQDRANKCRTNRGKLPAHLSVLPGGDGGNRRKHLRASRRHHLHSSAFW